MPVPRRKARKLVRAQRLASLPDLVAYRDQQRVVHRLPSGLALLVEVQHLDQVGGFAGELLVSDGINVELVAGDILGFGAVGGLEVDDRLCLPKTRFRRISGWRRLLEDAYGSTKQNGVRFPFEASRMVINGAVAIVTCFRARRFRAGVWESGSLDQAACRSYR